VQVLLLNGHLSVIEAADVNEAIAWKNGYFQFKDEKIESVMRKISRWYNIELQYQGAIPDEGFNGVISRSKNISQVLKMLEKTEAVHFNIEGRRVTVIK
jgi:transmembrane sensor